MLQFGEVEMCLLGSDNPGMEYLPPTRYVSLGKPLNFLILCFPKYKLGKMDLQKYEFSLR